MVGISTDYRKVDLLNYLKSHDIQFLQYYHGPNLYKGVTAELGIDRAPLAILVDSTGTIVSIGKSAEELWSFLEENLPG